MNYDKAADEIEIYLLISKFQQLKLMMITKIEKGNQKKQKKFLKRENKNIKNGFMNAML